MADDNDMKKWNVPSAIMFVASVAAAVALFALHHPDYGALVLAATIGIAIPQPLRSDR